MKAKTTATNTTAEQLTQFLTLTQELPKRWAIAPPQKVNSIIAYARKTYAEYIELKEEVRQIREEGKADIQYAQDQYRSVRKQANVAIKIYKATTLQTVHDAKEIVYLTKQVVSKRIEEGVRYLNEEFETLRKEEEIDNLYLEIETIHDRISQLQSELYDEPEEMGTYMEDMEDTEDVEEVEDVEDMEEVASFQTVLSQSGEDFDKINADLSRDAEDQHAEVHAGDESENTENES